MFFENSFPINVSSIVDFFSYFPPPPPVIPSPPPRRLWTCSSLSCFVSDDRNTREYLPIHDDRRTKFIESTSQLTQPSESNQLSVLTRFFLENRSAWLFFGIFFSIFLLILIISSIALSRHRRRTTTTMPRVKRTDSRKFYYSLLPHRRRRQPSKITEDKSIQLTELPQTV